MAYVITFRDGPLAGSPDRLINQPHLPTPVAGQQLTLHSHTYALEEKLLAAMTADGVLDIWRTHFVPEGPSDGG